jgi:hypothetical protein
VNFPPCDKAYKSNLKIGKSLLFERKSERLTDNRLMDRGEGELKDKSEK